MTSEAFVKVFVALRRADAESETAEQFDEQKKEILTRNGVTPDQMREFVRDYSQDPARMANLWDTIEARLRNPPRDSASQDTAHAPPRSVRAGTLGVPNRPDTLHRPGLLPRPGMLRRPDTLPQPGMLRRPDTLHRPDMLHRPDTLRRPGAGARTDVIPTRWWTAASS
ncbi:MAG: hypothetical protein P8099_06910 [Gemmatimonadota bacterium]